MDQNQVDVPPKDAADSRSALTDPQATQTFQDSSATPSQPDADRLNTGPVAESLSGSGYEVLRVIGQGGMGVVYLARHLQLKRLVAIKTIRATDHAQTQAMERFHIEAEAMARLQHPNVVQVFEVGTVRGQPFIVLEYVDGGNLAKLLADSPLSARDTARMATTLASAVQTAHAQGIIHRDLKPANVLLTKSGTPKITDFGLAKQLDTESSQTQTGQILGTPSYMAPEQARGEAGVVGELTDVYALGAILYEMQTGRPPFRAASVLDTLEQVRTQDPVPLTQLQPKCPPDLETICLKCLRKEPRQRYANCDALIGDLQRFLAGEPIHARPVTRAERIWRWCRRNPRIAAMSAGLGVLLIAVVTSFFVLAVRVDRERQAIAATRVIAGQRLQSSVDAISVANYQRALDLLWQSDPMLDSSAELTDLRHELQTLEAQVTAYAKFRRLLDDARFVGYFGSRQKNEEGRRYCRELLELYSEIEQGVPGLPPLNAEQRQFFKEDVVEAFLLAAKVEVELAQGDPVSELDAARQSIDWLNRADQLLPGTRVVYVNRARYRSNAGDQTGEAADMEKARNTVPASAIDHFWRGFADHLRGDFAANSGDTKASQEFYRNAVDAYGASLRRRPDNFWGYFNWANSCVQLGELPNSRIGYTICIRLRPDFAWPYNNRGTASLRRGEYDLAIADFTTALAIFPEYLEAYGNRGLAYRVRGDFDLALADFSRVIEFKADNVTALTERCEIYRSRQQHAQAAEDLTRLLSLSADKSAIHEKRAEAYRALNRPDDAIQDLGEAVNQRPDNLELRAQRFDLLKTGGRFFEARDELDRILILRPETAAVVRARAIIHWMHLKDFDRSLNDWHEFSRLSPKDPEPYRCIGEIWLGRRQYCSALESLQKALDLRPDYSEVLFARAQISFWSGRHEEALKDLDTLVDRIPEWSVDSLTLRGDVYRAMGRIEDAAGDYDRIISSKPQDPAPYVALARLREAQGQSEKAVECLDRLVAAAPDSEWAYLRRAEYRRDVGRYDAALADCDEANRRKPEWPLAALTRASIDVATGRKGALDDAKRLMEIASKDDGHVLYTTACVWSLASRVSTTPEEVRNATARATELLTQALDKGFHDFSYEQLNRMIDDPVWRTLRDHAGVHDLLAHRPQLTN